MQIFQVNYVLGDSGRSWLAGFGSDFPTFIWHKLSYNSFIDWPTRGITIFSNWSQEQTDGTYKTLLNGPSPKFDMECARPRGTACSAQNAASCCVTYDRAFPQWYRRLAFALDAGLISLTSVAHECIDADVSASPCSVAHAAAIHSVRRSVGRAA